MPVVVDKKICVGCGNCIFSCPVEALAALWGYCEIDYDKCTDCLDCINWCPSDAINEEK